MTQLACALHVVPPGKRAYPFHAHHENEEMFFILSGRGEYRCGEDTFPIKPGDVIAAPAGKTAHQIVNSGAEELRYLGISTIGSIDLVEYPDSNKFAVAAGVKNADFKSATLYTWAARASHWITGRESRTDVRYASVYSRGSSAACTPRVEREEKNHGSHGKSRFRHRRFR